MSKSMTMSELLVSMIHGSGNFLILNTSLGFFCSRYFSATRTWHKRGNIQTLQRMPGIASSSDSLLRLICPETSFLILLQVKACIYTYIHTSSAGSILWSCWSECSWSWEGDVLKSCCRGRQLWASGIDRRNSGLPVVGIQPWTPRSVEEQLVMLMYFAVRVRCMSARDTCARALHVCVHARPPVSSFCVCAWPSLHRSRWTDHA